MCLTAVDVRPKRKPGIGYKLAQRKEDTFLSCDYGRKVGQVEYSLNSWITDDEDYSITAKSGVKYRTGFHISLSKEHIIALVNKNNARMDNLVTIKCKFRKVVASDTESNDLYGPVVVAREMMNLGGVA